MPEFHLNTEGMPGDLGELEIGFLEALFFTAHYSDEGEDDILNSPVADLAPEALDQIRKDCAHFRKLAGRHIDDAQGWKYHGAEYDERRIGHDFLFTRNGHGVGFWDHPCSAMNTKQRDSIIHLDHIAGKFSPEFDLYRGDDGKLYVY